MLAAAFGWRAGGARGKNGAVSGWASIKNGALLKLAESGFDVFLTADRNLSFQQNLTQRKIAVVVLRAKSNRFQELLPLMPKILSVLATIKHGGLVEVSA